jgi:hypothetical protein
MEAIGRMKCFRLAFTLVFVSTPFVYSQVQPGRGINSPFATYEDANLAEAGTLSVGQYLSWRGTMSGDTLSTPGMNFTLGLNSGLELSGFSAVAFSRDTNDHLTAEADDSYLGLKVLLATQATYRPAIALKPMLEFLAGTGRPHYVLPAIVQKKTGFCDLALTGGYVTRGLAFGAAKCEWTIGSRFTPSAVAQVSRATQDVNAIRALGLNRTDVFGSAGVDIDLGSHWSLFLEAGRTIGRTDVNSSRFAFTTNIVYTGRLWGKRGENLAKEFLRFAKLPERI